MKHLILFGIALGSIFAGIAVADEPDGRRLFDNHCAECHAEGFGHPGTQRLGWSRGEQRAVLTKRTDLTVDYVKLIVRRGLAEMPPFRPSEISDAELARLSAYLAKTPVKAQ